MTTRTRSRLEPAQGRDDELRVRRGAVRFLAIPAHRFVALDGEGPPTPDAFEARMPGLYATAYAAHFALKRRGLEARVGPPEGVWWTATGATSPDDVFGADRTLWRWTLMIALPDEATDADLHDARTAGAARLDPEVARSLRVEPFEEGDVAQLLHVGPYSEERASVERLHAEVQGAGYALRGRHHELYLGDPRRSSPDRLRTILRHAVAPA